MTPFAAHTVAIAIALVAGWGVPALVIRALAPSLAESRAVVSNYRGRRVFVGLGVAWVAWAVTLLVANTLVDAAAPALLAVDSAYGSATMTLVDGPLTMPLYAVPAILTLGAAFFGMLDDVFGTHAEKGFRGHLTALAGGRLTTGGLKLIGIGSLAAVYGWRAAARAAEVAGVTDGWPRFAWWIAATSVIALTANLINLTDLRPGRALKTYVVLALVGATLFTLEVVKQYRAYLADAIGAWTAADTTITLLCMLVVVLGPAAAVWRLDLGEHGMLGDAGSNAMGAVVGYLFAASVSLPWLIAGALVLLGLNALSERVSFTSLIDGVAPLRFFDRLGRRPEAAEPAGEESGEAEGPRGRDSS